MTSLSRNPLPLDKTLAYRLPPSDEGGGPLAVEGGKKCSLYLFLSLDYGAVLSADSNLVI